MLVPLDAGGFDDRLAGEPEADESCGNLLLAGATTGKKCGADEADG